MGQRKVARSGLPRPGRAFVVLAALGFVATGFASLAPALDLAFGVAHAPISPGLLDLATSSEPVFRGALFLDEGFEGTEFPPADWNVFGNPVLADSATWKMTDDPAAVRTGLQAARVRAQSFNQQDENLMAPRVSLVGFPPEDLRLSLWYYASPVFADDADLLVQVSADSAGGGWDTLWRLRDAGVPGGWEWRSLLFDVGAYAGGDLWVRLRYFGRGGGDTSVDDVRLGYIGPPGPPVNDDCAGALAAAPVFDLGPAVGPFSIGGDNTLAGADYPLPEAATSCTGSSCLGRDLVWRVVLPGRHRVTATMTTAGGWDDTLFLIEDCADPIGTCVAGDRQIPDGSTIIWENQDDTERILWLIASAWGTGTGGFTIDGTIEPTDAVESVTWGRVKARYR